MKHYKTMLRVFLSAYAESLRKARNLSQEQMAELLKITPRAYSNLKNGKFCFSILPLLCMLLLLDDNEFNAFQEDLRDNLKALEATLES